MLTVNRDDALKGEFSKVVKGLGLNATSTINLFARAVVREKGIPFDITLRMNFREARQSDFGDVL